jgi:hypothetical protein
MRQSVVCLRDGELGKMMARCGEHTEPFSNSSLPWYDGSTVFVTAEAARAYCHRIVSWLPGRSRRPRGPPRTNLLYIDKDRWRHGRDAGDARSRLGIETRIGTPLWMLTARLGIPE